MPRIFARKHNIGPVKKAIQICGGTMNGLAKRLNIRQQLVSMWLNKNAEGKPLSVIQGEMAVQIEAVTNGKVRRQDIRPDLYRGMISDDEYKLANKS